MGTVGMFLKLKLSPLKKWPGWVGVSPINSTVFGGNATYSKALPLSLVEGGMWVRVSHLTSSAGTDHW